MIDIPHIVIAVAQDPSARWDIVDVQRNRESIARALEREGVRTTVLQITKDDCAAAAGLEEKLKAAAPPLVFNLFEGFSDAPDYEEVFVAALERRGIAYTGNPAIALHLCLDKIKTWHALNDCGIPVPQARLVRGCGPEDMQRAAELRVPVFVKPCAEDASVGIDEQSLVTEPDRLPAVIAAKLQTCAAGLVVEEFIPGIEYAVGFLGSYPYEDLGIASIDFRQFPDMPPFLTYRSKWDCTAKEYKNVIPLPAKLDGDKAAHITAIARAAGKVLHCRGYFRVDLRERDGALYVLDVNPNPDLNEECGFARQAAARGYTYAGLLRKIIDCARQ